MHLRAKSPLKIRPLPHGTLTSEINCGNLGILFTLEIFLLY